MKGVGIILVVLGHYPVVTFPELSGWIFAFHMPLFAFVGGLFFRVELVKDFTVKKIKRLLIPFFIWSLSFWLLYSIVIYFTEPELLSQQLKHLFFIMGGSGRNAVDGYANVTLWFLPFLFSVSLIHLLASKFNQNKWIEYGGVIAISLLGLLCGVFGWSLPYKINTAFTLYPFFWAGTRYLAVIRTWGLRLPLSLKISLFAVLIATYIFSVLFNSGVDTASNVIGNYFLFYFGAFGAVGALCFISEKIGSVGFVNYFGRNSLIVLIFHLPLILLAKYVVSLMGIGMSWATDIVIPSLVLLSCVPLIILVNRLAPFLIGEKRTNR